MGGCGGGSSGSPVDKNKLQRILDESLANVDSDRLEGNVNEVLQELLADFNDRNVQEVQDILREIVSVAGEAIDIESHLFGGSVAKHTYVDGLSDIDTLVVVSGGVASPKELLEQLYSQLKTNLGYRVEKGQLAVTIHARGHEIQMLPCFRDGSRILISSPSGDRWSTINPVAFTSALSAKNRELNYSLVRAIKLLKSVNAKLPKEHQLSGYHIEAMSLNAMSGFAGAKTTKQVLLHAVGEIKRSVLTPTSDVTGQSNSVDEYLGSANSHKRQAIAAEFATIESRLLNARRAEEWREIIG